MLYISFGELLGTAIEDVGFLKANIAFFVGIAVFALVDILVTHSYEEESAEDHRFGLMGEEKKPRRCLRLKGAGYYRPGHRHTQFSEGLITFSAAATGDISLGIDCRSGSLT